MQVRIEKLSEDAGIEKYRFVRVNKLKNGKSTLEIIGASFVNNGVVPDEIINDLRDGEREYILKNLPAIISRVSDVGSF
jgi:hypothetical protein